ncbi:hypothetical protein [Flavobacterium sp.]|uniref:hypothetical protein n=1 Tax=Flavobacterium sp. TaxID=239 RepID=UPI00286DC78F|nr:hypothetical protein [Flavobacterium sp.]
MLFKNNLLTSEDFNDKVSGLNNQYSCWSKDIKTAKDGLSEGKNLICIVSTSYPKGNSFVRDYVYVGFHTDLESFFSIDFNDYYAAYFLFIPTESLKKDDINDIILDIQNIHSKHKINELEIKLIE